jgi:aspartyl-tRNA(Asn)/glutamyl-tRNA(Gln) amidotransferase subunit A
MSASIQQALAAIRDRDPALHAFLAVDAAAAEGAHGGVLGGVFAGVPLAVKDNLVTRALPTTAGSKMLAGYVAPYTATAVARLEAAGAVVVGKTNLDEFGMGSSTENSAFGPTRNPWNIEHIPGGSSGGSAAAVAAGLVEIALGSDTGGSIRQPAALCGVVGLKPTWGRVSRYGLVAYASSLDTIGPITRTVTQAAKVLGVIAGADPFDMTASRAAVPDYLAALDVGAAGLRVGFAEAWLDGVSAGVADTLRRTARALERAGATVSPIALPDPAASLAAYYVIAPAEAASNLGRYDGVRYGHRASRATGLSDLYERSRSEGFGAETTRRILLGTFVLSAGYADAYYGRAQRVRARITADFDAALASVDVILAPTAPGPAPRLGAVHDPLDMYLLDTFTIGANLAGLPAIHVPTDLEGGLPVGVQLLGRRFHETVLLRAARAVERAADFTGRPT